jgi:hypothetical protein
MKTLKLVYKEPQSPEVSELVGAWEGESATLCIYEVLEGGGYMFTYDNCFDNHDMYAKGPNTPFATQQEALETATWTKDDGTHSLSSWDEEYENYHILD